MRDSISKPKERDFCLNTGFFVLTTFFAVKWVTCEKNIYAVINVNPRIFWPGTISKGRTEQREKKLQR